MKYIKKYENTVEKYNIGDYVLLVDHFVSKQYSLLARIEDIHHDNRYKIKRFKIVHEGDDRFPMWATDWYTFYDVERHLTPEEIEIFKMKEDINKYNL